MTRLEVRIWAQGVEVAKWMARGGSRSRLAVGDLSGLPTAPAGVHCIHLDTPVVRSLSPDELPVVTLDEGASVEFSVGHPLLCAEDAESGPVALLAYALLQADAALGGMLSRCERVQAEVG